MQSHLEVQMIYFDKEPSRAIIFQDIVDKGHAVRLALYRHRYRFIHQILLSITMS